MRLSFQSIKKFAEGLFAIPSYEETPDGGYDFSEPLPFDELPEDVQGIAVGNYSGINIEDNDAFDGVTDMFKEDRLEPMGIRGELNEHSFGGGSAWDFHIADYGKFAQALWAHVERGGHVGYPHWTLTLRVMLEGAISVQYRHGRGHMGGTTYVEDEGDLEERYPDTDWKYALNDVEEHATLLFQELEGEHASAMQKELDYQGSYEQIVETFRANGYTFDANGKIASHAQAGQLQKTAEGLFSEEGVSTLREFEQIAQPWQVWAPMGREVVGRGFIYVVDPTVVHAAPQKRDYYAPYSANYTEFKHAFFAKYPLTSEELHMWLTESIDLPLRITNDMLPLRLYVTDIHPMMGTRSHEAHLHTQAEGLQFILNDVQVGSEFKHASPNATAVWVVKEIVSKRTAVERMPRGALEYKTIHALPNNELVAQLDGGRSGYDYFVAVRQLANPKHWLTPEAYEARFGKRTRTAEALESMSTPVQVGMRMRPMRHEAIVTWVVVFVGSAKAVRARVKQRLQEKNLGIRTQKRLQDDYKDWDFNAGETVVEFCDANDPYFFLHLPLATVADPNLWGTEEQWRKSFGSFYAGGSLRFEAEALDAAPSTYSVDDPVRLTPTRAHYAATKYPEMMAPLGLTESDLLGARGRILELWMNRPDKGPLYTVEWDDPKVADFFQEWTFDTVDIMPLNTVQAELLMELTHGAFKEGEEYSLSKQGLLYFKSKWGWLIKASTVHISEASNVRSPFWQGFRDARGGHGGIEDRSGFEEKSSDAAWDALVRNDESTVLVLVYVGASSTGKVPYLLTEEELRPLVRTQISKTSDMLAYNYTAPEVGEKYKLNRMGARFVREHVLDARVPPGATIRVTDVRPANDLHWQTVSNAWASLSTPAALEAIHGRSMENTVVQAQMGAHTFLLLAHELQKFTNLRQVAWVKRGLTFTKISGILNHEDDHGQHETDTTEYYVGDSHLGPHATSNDGNTAGSNSFQEEGMGEGVHAQARHEVREVEVSLLTFSDILQRSTVYPTVEDIIELNEVVMEEEQRQVALRAETRGLLEAAIGRMQSGFGDYEAFPTLIEKAAVLMHSIITTHPFSDGNKRTSILASMDFLRTNGLTDDVLDSYMGIDENDLADLTVKLSSREMSHEEFVQWFHTHHPQNTVSSLRFADVQPEAPGQALPVVMHPEYYAFKNHAGNVWQMDQYQAAVNDLHTQDSPEHYQYVEPEAATEADALLVHTPEYVQDVFGPPEKSMEARHGWATKWDEGGQRAVLRSAGGLMRANEEALRAGVSVQLFDMGHHAYPDRGEGYCVLNDLAIAAKKLSAQGKRVMIVDTDVHQGQGTAVCTANDPNIFTLSTHELDNYPSYKERSSLDVELAPKTTDRQYLSKLQAALVQATETFGTPDLVMYVAGTDLYGDDRLSHTRVTLPGLRKRDSMVFAHFGKLGVPVSVTIPQGYARKSEDTRQMMVNTMREARKALVYYPQLQARQASLFTFSEGLSVMNAPDFPKGSTVWGRTAWESSDEDYHYIQQYEVEGVYPRDKMLSMTKFKEHYHVGTDAFYQMMPDDPVIVLWHPMLQYYEFHNLKKDLGVTFFTDLPGDARDIHNDMGPETLHTNTSLFTFAEGLEVMENALQEGQTYEWAEFLKSLRPGQVWEDVESPDAMYACIYNGTIIDAYDMDDETHPFSPDTALTMPEVCDRVKIARGVWLAVPEEGRVLVVPPGGYRGLILDRGPYKLISNSFFKDERTKKRWMRRQQGSLSTHAEGLGTVEPEVGQTYTWVDFLRKLAPRQVWEVGNHLLYIFDPEVVIAWNGVHGVPFSIDNVTDTVTIKGAAWGDATAQNPQEIPWRSSMVTVSAARGPFLLRSNTFFGSKRGLPRRRASLFTFAEGLDVMNGTDFERATQGKKVRISYTKTTPESAETGDFSDSGWQNEEGEEFNFDLEDYLDFGGSITDYIGQVVGRYLLDEGATEDVGGADDSYFTYYENTDMTLNEETQYGYHLVGFTVDELRAVADAVIEGLKRRQMRAAGAVDPKSLVHGQGVETTLRAVTERILDRMQQEGWYPQMGGTPVHTRPTPWHIATGWCEVWAEAAKNALGEGDIVWLDETDAKYSMEGEFFCPHAVLHYGGKWYDPEVPHGVSSVEELPVVHETLTKTTSLKFADVHEDSLVADQDVETEPSEAQIEAGNYKKGHVRLHGLDIVIENPKGSTRCGKDRDGHEWSQEMHSDYGYIKGVRGKDKDELDVVVGEHHDSEFVYVVNQKRKGGRGFDEHKVVMGTHNEEDAIKEYLSNYEKDWLEQQGGTIDGHALTIQQFKDWLEAGTTTEPLTPKAVQETMDTTSTRAYRGLRGQFFQFYAQGSLFETVQKYVQTHARQEFMHKFGAHAVDVVRASRYQLIGVDSSSGLLTFAMYAPTGETLLTLDIPAVQAGLELGAGAAEENLRAIVEAEGATFNGIQRTPSHGSFVVVTEKTTGSTGLIPLESFSPAVLKQKLEDIRERFRG
jgi:death-on-curing family protein